MQITGIYWSFICRWPKQESSCPKMGENSIGIANPGLKNCLQCILISLYLLTASLCNLTSFFWCTLASSMMWGREGSGSWTPKSYILLTSWSQRRQIVFPLYPAENPEKELRLFQLESCLPTWTNNHQGQRDRALQLARPGEVPTPHWGMRSVLCIWKHLQNHL